ncbi:hypothetical protein Ahy_A09g045434 [Arachis hypogaea]|uniref:Ubiquitin-like protease family profile domain-containing protein n=1 Tax=Arachis hypogaea TaxID=3818 RepID=A0A445BMC5_ARAHY|nr:hypothetical protein Ahy_A09g045434 [Arachis hypogaea]
MAHSSTSPSNKTQTFKLRATFQTEKIELVTEISRNHQQKIELSINNFKRKRRNITQEKMAARNQPGRNQTKDLKCATHLLSDKFRNMSEEKKTIVRNLGFGGLMHIPPLRVHHQVLRELANNFNLGENRLKTGYGSFKITPRKIGDALDINATGDLFPQKVNYKKLSEDDKGITDYKEKKKKAIDGCLFALMIIYFHLSKNKGKKRAERPPKAWIANWSKEQLVEIMSAETEKILTETTDSDSSTSESETQEDSEDSPRKQPSKKEKKMDSRERKKSQEDSDSDSESESSDESEESSPVEKQKKKKKTQRTPKNERYEIGSEDLDELLRGIDEKSAAEGIPDVNLGSDDPSSQGCTEQSSVNNPAESMLSPVQQSASEPADLNMIVMKERTLSEALAIVPIQVFVPVSQTATVPEFEETPEIDFEPTPLLQIEGKLQKSAEDAAALLMMAQTTSYAPRTDQMPSFSLGLTDSSQEEASMQEGASTNAAKEESKSPQIQRETVGESSGRFETPAEINLNTDDMKQKCYIWGTRVKTYADGRTNEYENMCTLMAQYKYILTKMHIASLQAATFIEAEIVSAMCLILNQTNDKRFQKQVYCLPPDIVNMAISKHPNGKFISPKTNKEFRMEDYPSFIPFIDAKKLTSHSYGYVISRMRAYVGGEPLKKGEKEKEIKASYVKISFQKSTYDCAIYVMKWLKLIEPENIKKGKYEWDNWK